MAWKKYFKATNPNSSGQMSVLGGSSEYKLSPGYSNFASQLPEVYIGHPNRIERYNQYEQMDMDSEVNAALDIIAEFCSQPNLENGTGFNFFFKEDPTDHEIKILKDQLQHWVSLNKFNTRLFKIVRNVLKYGDQAFIRDPETFELYWTEMYKVIKVIVNESEGKEPEQYIIKDLNINFQNLTATAISASDTYMNHPQLGGPSGAYIQPNAPFTGGSRFSHAQNESAINAEHVLHVSLTEGLDVNWPFGTSILESVFKIYKQKELLEDAVIIYRVQRAPERRVFKIDTGNMPAHMAMAFVERIKNEIHQRRIPTSTGGGQNMMDATYNPLCLGLDTKIPLLDGRTLMLSELIDEFSQGKENWAYSCNPETGEVVPGVISWAGVTRLATDVIELTFDNGKTLVCTPDHKIPVFGRGFVEAQHLTINDSLISFNTRNTPISGGKTSEYQQVWNHLTNTWVWTHRMVGEFFRKLGKHQEFTYLEENLSNPKTVIHHKNSDRFNNDPRNLTYMNKEDHMLYHSSTKKQYWADMDDSEYTRITGQISNTVKENWKKMSDIDKQSALFNIRQAQRKAVWMRQHDPITKVSYKLAMQQSRKKYFEDNPLFLEQVKKNLESRVPFKNLELNVTFDMLQIVAELVKSYSKNKNDVLSLCDKNQRLLSLVKTANDQPLDYKNAQCKINFNTFGYSKLDKLLTTFGYKNWKHFTKEIENFNHKVVSIKTMSARDVGTITIDRDERWHDHHTFATDSGIFVKNSIMEDYFFPTGADGRGSDVSVLPGGQNLGEITDLRFFTNKLFRALRIPSSYLPTGDDEGSQAFNDGRVGTALIQEWRFNQYCKRLQNLIVEKLDKEFKMFIRWRGINIDNQLFSLHFNEPQNFAKYRQAELDSNRISAFTQLEQYPYLSKRFLLERFLSLTPEEIQENSELWAEENDDAPTAPVSGLRSVGISSGDISQEMTNLEPPPPEDEEGGALDAPMTDMVGEPGSGAPPADAPPGAI